MTSCCSPVEVLQLVLEVPPFSSETTRILPSELTSAWCEMAMSLELSPGSESWLGMIEMAGADPSSIRLASTIQVELIAATYIVSPSREKETSCGRHSPEALEPFGRSITTHSKLASV